MRELGVIWLGTRGFHFWPNDKKETINITFRSASELSLSHVNRFTGRKKIRSKETDESLC